MSKPELTYPLTFIMKVIMRREESPGANRQALENAFSVFSVSCGNWTEKTSAAGRYTSYSVEVTVPDHDLFLEIHEAASRVEGVRYVL